MKRLLLGSLLSVSLGFPIAFEYPYIYKDPRVMGMGGAYVAVGGTSASLFYNPAGIGKIKKEAGFEVDLIGVTAAVSKDGYKFLQDFQDALDTGDLDGDGDTSDDQLEATLDVLKEYRGKVLHFSVDTFPSVARRFGNLGVALGGIAVLKFDAVPHQGFSSQGLLSVDTSLTYGGVGGLSYGFLNEKLTLGVGIKQLSRELVQKDFTARELVENQDDLDNYINDEVKKSGSATGVDVGVIYDLAEIFGFKASVGASYMNIGDLDFGEAGNIPGTLNAGLALKKEGSSAFLSGVTLALDVVDLTKNYEQDEDWGKRLRAGAELKVWNGKLSDFILRVGSYQGYLTAGAELRFLLLRVVATTYAEEVGAYSGQDENRRYMLSAYITW
ncbi:hypothetical protein [Hydrogenivirga sp. 128-5-R1-1]|uniref:hypothetical protein n=1 Tax=Hydrogenivirga sp. 128-5-R1-1 TaxID=392423 RepID=UPI00015F3780|nr:hypothetical protein [Hydrogenivirga sp. 128-5-R1-1]EDP76568.1 hypothetical protein HG1285_03138 [Hydrogenivirga sp. 128-5-R1-1]